MVVSVFWCSEMVEISYSDEVKSRFPDLKVLIEEIEGVEVKRKSEELEEFKQDLVSEVRENRDIEDLKEVSVFRKYRDFFWDIDIDPTKTRPAAEALVRRILQGKELPTINTLVDAYNLASLKSEIPLAVFDSETIEGNLKMRFSKEDEKFVGIGMDDPKELTGDEIVVSDEEKIIAIYPYRDSEETKITNNTENILMMVCGVPGVESKLEQAREITLNYITKFCGGKVR